MQPRVTIREAPDAQRRLAKLAALLLGPPDTEKPDTDSLGGQQYRAGVQPTAAKQEGRPFDDNLPPAA